MLDESTVEANAGIPIVFDPAPNGDRNEETRKSAPEPTQISTDADVPIVLEASADQ